MESSLAAICTKARANYGKLLKKEHYEKLLESKSYEETLRYLRENTRYKMVISSSLKDEADLIEIEQKLMQFYMDEFYKFNYYLQDNYKLLLKTLFIKYQIKDIKKVIRLKHKKYTTISEVIDKTFITEKSPFNKLNFDRLINAETLEETAQILKGTIYYNRIKELSKNQNDSAYFKCEMQLDYEYFKAINSINRKMKIEEGLKLEGEYEDLSILKSIFRQKKYFSKEKLMLDEEQNINGYKLKGQDILKLSATKDVNEFLKLTEKFGFSELHEKSIKNSRSIQKEIEEYMKKQYKVQKKKNDLSIEIVIAYMEMFMDEIKNIISVLECKNYNLSADICQKYIV